MSTRIPDDLFLCESGDTMSPNHCGHTIPIDTYDALDSWRDENGVDGLYIVRSECALGFKVIQRYGNYCLIEDRPFGLQEHEGH